MKTSAIVVAAGRGERMGAGVNKVLLEVGGKSVLAHTLFTIAQCGCFDEICIVCRDEERGQIAQIAHDVNVPSLFASGGQTRQESVENALLQLSADTEIIAVHDGARCFATAELFVRCIKSAAEFGSGVAGKRAVDTVKRVVDNKLAETLDRREIVLIETPQVFQAPLLRNAYAKAKADNFIGTDDASLVERLGVFPRFVESNCENRKLTHPEDLLFAERNLRGALTVGFGQDVHAFVPDRKLILGGVEIPFHLGLLGHSDADVLTHAVMDALLGAAGICDIGQLFPDDDPRYLGISSLLLLARVGDAIREAGFLIENIDATLALERPKIAPYRESIRSNLAEALRISSARVNVKATTFEGLGFVGRGEGAQAQAVCLLARISNFL